MKSVQSVTAGFDNSRQFDAHWREFAGMVCSWDIAKFPADDPSRNDAKLGRLRKELTTLVAEINAGKQSPDGSVTDEAGDRELALRWQIATIPAAGLGGIIVKLETACDDFLPASLGWHINDLDIAQRILYEALRDANDWRSAWKLRSPNLHSFPYLEIFWQKVYTIPLSDFSLPPAVRHHATPRTKCAEHYRGR